AAGHLSVAGDPVGARAPDLSAARRHPIVWAKLKRDEDRMNRRHVLKTGAASLAALSLGRPLIAQAAEWPTKSIRVVVPYAAGSATDLVPRTVFEQVGHQVGQSFVIENRPGGGTTVGSAQVKQSDPDGHTVLVHSNAIVTVPAIQANVPYDPVKDF